MVCLMRTIVTENLTTEAFAPYGQVLAQPLSGKIDRVSLTNDRDNATLDFIIVRPRAFALPLTIDQLECHPSSSQSFLPPDVRTYLIVVAHSDDKRVPDLSTLRAFEANGTLGVNVDAGIWHRAVSALTIDGSFATITFYAGDGRDTVMAEIPACRVDRRP